MSPNNRSDAIKDGARHAAEQLRPAVERARPLAKNTSAAARRGILRTRGWAAPHVERTGHVLQDTVAPRVSAMLSSAAKRIDPAQPRHRRWQKPAGLATLAAAGGAVAAFFGIRRKQQEPAMTQADQVKAAGNGQPTTGLGADTGASSEVQS